MITKEKKIHYPILFDDKTKCCGCGACKNICPMKAIDMIPDEKGFLYPVIDKNKCKKCSICLKVCPLKNNTCLNT